MKPRARRNAVTYQYLREKIEAAMLRSDNLFQGSVYIDILPNISASNSS